MNDLLTVHQVAELLQHPEPQSRAGAAKVGRLVERGLPFVRGTRPRLFIRHQVLAWLEGQANAPAPAAPPPTRPRRGVRASSGGLAERIAAMRCAR